MRCGVLGDPIAHSLSPDLHRAAYDALRLTGWSYDAVRVPAGALAEFLGGLGEEWRGLSLTMPLKREAMALASRVSARAELVGAANTLVRGDDGWHADNTDLPGAVGAVRERWSGEVTAGTVVGAGATAASTGLALCELGARRVRLLARSPERAAETVGAISRHFSAPVVEVAPLDAGGLLGEVVVSTIPAGAQDPSLVDRLAGAPVVFEAVYDPWPTPLAAAAGGVLVSGLDLLVHQAVLQVEAFTGLPAPVEVLRAAGERVLAAR